MQSYTSTWRIEQMMHTNFKHRFIKTTIQRLDTSVTISKMWLHSNKIFYSLNRLRHYNWLLRYGYNKIIGHFSYYLILFKLLAKSIRISTICIYTNLYSVNICVSQIVIFNSEWIRIKLLFKSMIHFILYFKMCKTIKWFSCKHQSNVNSM